MDYAFFRISKVLYRDIIFTKLFIFSNEFLFEKQTLAASILNEEIFKAQAQTIDFFGCPGRAFGDH